MSDEKKSSREEKASKDVEIFEKRLFGILDHIQNVKDNGRILIKGLIEEGELDLALKLAYRLSVHDASKFQYIEWSGMYSDNEAIKKAAIEHHRRTNPHHIQYHSDIKDMCDVDLAELVCDVKARSEEFGTGIKEFIKKFAEDRQISVHSYFYKKVMHFLNLIIEPTFKNI